MMNDVTQIITRWFNHQTYGVNALLPNVPRNIIGTSDDWPEPAVVAIYDDTMGIVSNNKIELEPPSTPCIMSFAYSDMVYDAEDRRQIARAVVIATAYCTSDTPADVSIRDGGLTLRACKQSLERFNHQRHAEGYREYNKIKVAKVDDVTIHGVAGAVGRAKMWGLMFTTLKVIDQQP